jgi:predicted aspartyl protease
MVSGVAAAPDAAVLDAQTLRARMAAAEGAPNLNYSETVVGTTSDGSIISTHNHRADDDRITETRGPIRTSYGTYRGTDWHQNANGITVTDLPDPVPAAPLTEVATVQHAFSPIDAYVISELDAGGYGVREYVDPRSYLVLRRDDIRPAGTTTTTNTAYARFGTQFLPASWRVEDHSHHETTTYTRTRFHSGNISVADVARPAARQIVSLPPGKTSVDLHARFDGGQISVPVSIAGRTFFFLLDSGASALTIDPALAKQLGLELMNVRHEVAGNRFEAHDTVIPAIDVGGLRMHGVVASVVLLGMGRKPSDPVGLLGFDFLAGLAVRIDYEHQRVLAMNPHTYEPPSGTDVSAINLRLGSQVPMVDADLGGAISQRLIVDTGSPGAILLFDHFSRRHNDVLRSPIDDAATSLGIGGAFQSRPFRMRYVRLGRFAIGDLVADAVTSRSAYPQENDGLIGSDLLQFFTVDLNYAAGRIFLRARPTLKQFVSYAVTCRRFTSDISTESSENIPGPHSSKTRAPASRCASTS